MFSIVLYLCSFLSLYAEEDHLKVGLKKTVVDGTDINPGDTIKVQAGQRDYILFRNIEGAQGNPVVIINDGGQVEFSTNHWYAIKFQTCKYIKFTGKGHASYTYGFYVRENTNTSGTGVSVDNMSTDVEIENIEVSNIHTAGLYAKTEPDINGDCSFAATRDKFTMYNLSIHDCYFHDISDEGMYIGSSKYTGQTVYTSGCSGTEVLPHVIEGVQVYNNIVENTGWDGIQVSSATKDCAIYNNTIRQDSYRETDGQMSGILIGGGSSCNCYNNKIFDGKGDGIDILGLGNHKVYNNLIVRAGKTFKPEGSATSNPKHGIWVGHVDTEAGSEILIYNNTIISPKTHGMKLTNVSINSYKIYNNIISEPGAASVLGGDNELSYMNISNLISYQKSNFYHTNDQADVQFIHPDNDNYDLEALSPAVNAGLDMSNFDLTTDIDGKTRPYAGAYDIGAYESHEHGISIEENLSLLRSKVKLEKVRQSPTLSSAKVFYELKESMHVKLFIMTLEGKIVEVLVDQKQAASNYSFRIDKKTLSGGFYFLILDCKYGRLSEKFIIL